jgi:hypothetical protein
MRELIVLWILAAMTALAPPHREHYVQLAKESYAQADARYREIAEAIVDESFAGRPLFGGKGGRISTAMLVTTIFFMESGFRRDIDLGIGNVRLRRAGLNDFGRSWCMGQINLGFKRVPDPDHPGMWKETSTAATPDGWYGPDLTADRRKCVRATINALRLSMSTCRSLPADQRLAAYAAGNCESETGKRLSEARMRLFFRWNARGRPNTVDEQVLKEMNDAQPAAAQPARVGGDSESAEARVLRVSSK